MVVAGPHVVTRASSGWTDLFHQADPGPPSNASFVVYAILLKTRLNKGVTRPTLQAVQPPPNPAVALREQAPRHAIGLDARSERGLT